jgi:hypothetical protein
MTIHPTSVCPLLTFSKADDPAAWKPLGPDPFEQILASDVYFRAAVN